MKLHSSFARWGGGVLIPAAILTVLAFTGNPHIQTAVATPLQDTIPTHKRNKTTREEGDRDLDKELRQLDKAEKNIDELKEKDWDKVQRDVEEAMKKIDMEKVKLQAEEAMRKVDFDKINRQVDEAMKKIDMEKIQQQINQSLDEVAKIDKEAIRKQLQEAQQQVKEAMEKQEWKEELQKEHFNKDKIEKEMEHAKQSMEKAQEELQHQKFDFKKDFDKAKVAIDKSREEVKGYQEMIYAMEKDGLLDTKGDYSIQYKNDELFINDKKQPQDVTDKYKKYFKKSTYIKKQDGDIQISQHNPDAHLD